MATSEVGLDHPVLDKAGSPLLSAAQAGERTAGSRIALDRRQLLGGLFVAAGLMTLMIGWWQISGTRDTNFQLAYLLSGGIGGAALMGIGALFLVAFQHEADRTSLAQLEERLVRLEEGLGGEFDNLAGLIRSGKGD